MKNVLVTGGTGFIGSNLAVELLGEGCHVRILRRQNSDLRAIGNADVEHCIGDIRDLDSLRSAVKGCDTVFHTAAMVSYWRKERELMYDVNIRGTRNVVQACLEASVQKLVHTSSVAAIGYPENGGLSDEDNLFNWERYDVGYRISKHEAEAEILRGVKLGLSAVMVNPAVVIGPRDIHFHGGQIIRDVYKKRIFYYVDGGMNIVYVADVVRGHIAAARLGRDGDRYILSGENLSHKQIFTTTAEVVGGFPPKLKLRTPVVKAVAALAEAIGNLTNTKPWVTQELVAGLGVSNFYSCEKAKRELAYTLTPFREAVEKTFAWYKANGMLG
jgi:dihydroflavonol-4-reductase